MVYFIYGNQNIRIRSQSKAIARKSLNDQIDEMNFVRFDGLITVTREVVDEANFVPLGYDYKVVILENCYFLTKEKAKNKDEEDKDFKDLIEYIKNPNPDCDLILTAATSEIDTKSEVYKALVEAKATIVPIKEPTPQEWIEIVKKYCSEKLNVKIDWDALKELSNRTMQDYGLLFNSASKLALYTDHITIKDVYLMISRPLEENTFQIFNELMDEQNMKALALYRDLKVTNVEPVVLVSMLASQFRLLDQTFYLKGEGLSAEEIGKELGIKPIRVTIMSKHYRKISSEKIKQTLEELYKLDKDIKSGLVDRHYAFELFLINFKLY